MSETAVAFTLSTEEKSILGDIASLAIGQHLADIPESPPKESSFRHGVLTEHLGCFVTLTKHGRLRGCIGSLVGQEPLYQNVFRMAKAAAFQDRRFPPVVAQEWPELELEISVLGPMVLCPNVEAIEVGRHGLLLVQEGRSGVFLPKVPVEQGWDLLAYLENLCHKAQLPSGSWKNPQAQLYWYEAVVFSVAR